MRQLKTSMTARFLIFFALFFAPVAFAEETPAPLDLKGGRVVSIDEAKAIFDSGEALFVDIRHPLNYGRGHIPSAIAIPSFEKNAANSDGAAFRKRLPADKNSQLVFYSHGETGWKSYRAAAMSIRAGYRNVSWMRDGLKGWTAKGFAVATGPEPEK